MMNLNKREPHGVPTMKDALWEAHHLTTPVVSFVVCKYIIDETNGIYDASILVVRAAILFLAMTYLLLIACRGLRLNPFQIANNRRYACRQTADNKFWGPIVVSGTVAFLSTLLMIPIVYAGYAIPHILEFLARLTFTLEWYQRNVGSDFGAYRIEEYGSYILAGVMFLGYGAWYTGIVRIEQE